MKLLKLIFFGNPVLRQQAQRLSADELKSSRIQRLIADIRYTNEEKDLGVGIAAPQVGESVALAVIDIRPTEIRPDVEECQMIIINPAYEGIGRRTGMWEGCLSSGSKRNILFGKALRYKKIQATWYDERAKKHKEILTGLVAQVFQHETDHLDGVLFVDRVRDTKTYMHAFEYKKRVQKMK